MRPPSQGQIAFLQRNHIDPSGIKHAGLANKIIKRFLNRIQHRLATPVQLSLLKQLGLPEDQAATLSITEASATIDKILAEKRSA